jgi:hypothetical protein
MYLYFVPPHSASRHAGMDVRIGHGEIGAPAGYMLS